MSCLRVVLLVGVVLCLDLYVLEGDAVLGAFFFFVEHSWLRVVFGVVRGIGFKVIVVLVLKLVVDRLFCVLY